MGLLQKIKEKQIRSFTRRACRSMFFAFNAAKEKYPDKKYYSDWAAIALSTRPGWKQINQSTFQHKSGGEIKIKKDESLVDVLRNIVIIEMAEFIRFDENHSKIIQIIIDEIGAYFTKK